MWSRLCGESAPRPVSRLARPVLRVRSSGTGPARALTGSQEPARARAVAGRVGVSKEADQLAAARRLHLRPVRQRVHSAGETPVTLYAEEGAGKCGACIPNSGKGGQVM